jgi:hypothetical protein
MNASSRSRTILPVVSLLAALALSSQAMAQGPEHEREGRPGAAARPGPVARPGGPVHPGGPGPARVGADARFARGAIARRDFGGHPYRGRLDWGGGRWRHEVHNGRDGWWWDVGGVWYFYPQQMDGPPTYVSDDFADDVTYSDAGPPPGPGPGYPPPQAAYAPPPPPPPPPDPAASAIGGAVVGGVLGGLLTGRASGAAAGAVIGGATGAIAGATAASRPGYWMAQGTCYYRYPSGQYVVADPRWCY